jgi:LysR family transcriptional regulator for metE and metH
MNDIHTTTPFRLDICDLEMISGVVDHGSLTRAAEALNLTQSALSHRLKNLEDRLGVIVFNRVGRSLQPTDAGRRLLETARDILARLASAEADVRRIADGSAGTIRISTECYTCYHWLPPVIRRFRADFPDVDIRVVAEATRDPLPALLAGTIDIALVTDSPADPRLYVHELFRDELVAVTDPQHKWAGRSYVTPADFTEEHLILYTTEDSAVLEDFLIPAGVRPKRISEIQITEGILELVKAGLGIGVLAGWAAAPFLESGTVASIRLGKTGLRRSWKAVTTVEQPFQAERRFIELLGEELG